MENENKKMILSDKYKFIFIRQQKIGGATMEKNGIAVIDPHHIKFTKAEVVAAIGPSREDPNHLSIDSIEKLVEQHKLDEYFKFTFVRNPWARLLSVYCHVKKGPGREWQAFLKSQGKPFPITYKKSFKQFIKEYDNSLWPNSVMSMKEFAGDVDFIGKTENLQDDFDYICDCIGAPKQDIGWINKGDHKSYIEYYDDETREIVAQRYAEDIEMFNYEFGK